MYLEIRASLLAILDGGQGLTFPEVVNALGLFFEDKEPSIKAYLSQMRKKGLVRVEKDEKDARKRIYYFKDTGFKLPLWKVAKRFEGQEKLLLDMLSIRFDGNWKGFVHWALEQAEKELRLMVPYVNLVRP